MLNKYLAQTENPEVKNWISTALNARLKKQPENQSEIEHIIDYLQSERAPKRLRKMSYAQAKNASEKWVKSLQKKGKYIDDLDQIEVIKKFKNGFRLIRLIGKEAFQREGNLMAHCVASYADKMDCKVYSLRDENNNPHCTMEVKTQGGELHQIKGKGNGSIHPKYIKMVLSIIKWFGKDVRSSEMQNLGYIHLEPYELEMLKNLPDFEKRYKIFKYKSNSYLFSGC